MASAQNLVCGRFINFIKSRTILTLLTFGYPTYNPPVLFCVQRKDVYLAKLFLLTFYSIFILFYENATFCAD